MPADAAEPLVSYEEFAATCQERGLTPRKGIGGDWFVSNQFANYRVWHNGRVYRAELELKDVAQTYGKLSYILDTVIMDADSEERVPRPSYATLEQTLVDCGMLIRRLIYKRDDKLASQAGDFLRRKGLQGSVLR